MVKKIGCMIYYYGERYKKIGKCAVDSFMKHHPDIEMYHIGDHNRHLYQANRFYETINGGTLKYMFAAEVMKKNKLDKIIILGGDTITCARLDEFVDNDEDVLVTLDYPYQFQATVGPRLIASPDNETHLNADVVCFNNYNALKRSIRLSLLHKEYREQGGLNELIWSHGKHDYTYKIVDGPYDESGVIYNVRSKGNICLPYEYQDHSAVTGKPPEFPPYEKPWGLYLKQFYVKDEKLYNKDHKQIKVWHYCDGFGMLSAENFKNLVTNYIQNWFNEETKRFFKEQCACGDFFEKEFTI
jgi:hypothetical protein